MAIRVLTSTGAESVYDASDWDVDERDRALTVYAVDSNNQPYAMAVYAPGAWLVVSRDAPPAEPAP